MRRIPVAHTGHEVDYSLNSVLVDGLQKYSFGADASALLVVPLIRAPVKLCPTTSGKGTLAFCRINTARAYWPAINAHPNTKYIHVN